MRFRADIIVTVVIVLLCAYAVVRQLGADPFGPDEPDVAALEIGDLVDGDLVLDFIGDPPVADHVGRWFGERATVFYSWSVPCPCTTVLEPRMRQLYARFGPQQGVEWIALDGEPYDTPALVRKHMEGLHAFYRLVLDPRQQLTRALGLDRAVQVVVLDSEHRIRYRGAPDDDYEDGDARFLLAALEHVLAGEAVPEPERSCDYGCFFNDPASCLEFEDGADTPAESRASTR